MPGGHTLHDECPETFNEAVDTFLRENAG